MNDDIQKSNQEKINQTKELFKQDQNGQSSSFGNVSSLTLEKRLVRYTYLRNVNGILSLAFIGLTVWLFISLAGCKGAECAGAIIPAFLVWPVLFFLIMTLIFSRKIRKIKKELEPKQ